MARARFDRPGQPRRIRDDGGRSRSSSLGASGLWRAYLHGRRPRNCGGRRVEVFDHPPFDHSPMEKGYVDLTQADPETAQKRGHVGDCAAASSGAPACPPPLQTREARRVRQASR